MRHKLTNLASIPDVIANMTLDEKLNLVGAYKACHTLEIPDMDISALNLTDGATGVNGVQVILDYITAPENKNDPELRRGFFQYMSEFSNLVKSDLTAARDKYKDRPFFLGLIDHIEKMRPDNTDFISFPSGINIGASFDPGAAYKIGQAVGCEMRHSGIDVCLGPNVDVARDPLGGRNYEMYGEDPELVAAMSAGFINGMQSEGVGACAKHFIANNQETNRNTKNTHVSERTLREIYSKGFMSAVKNAKVKSIMTAYNAINGTFSSYNQMLLTDWLRKEWGFEGLVVSDWGAATDNTDMALKAGLDLRLCGPCDMTECKKAVENGQLSEAVLDERVKQILKTLVELRQEQARIPVHYVPDELLQAAYASIVEGAVLLKNQHTVLPLRTDARITFFGKRSKELLECGTGSTSVITNLHSNVFDETIKNYPNVSVSYENMENADTLIYTVTAPAGENVDRSIMDIEEDDRLRIPDVLKTAKEKGLKTVVILNVSGPIDMRSWIDYADSILCIFIPGCMGGKAAADLLFGTAYPGGKLPVTFPLRYEDSPSYPNFPGEHNDVYYGEGIFIGYRNYEKRKIPVQFPFGFGLGYTDFQITVPDKSLTFNALENDFFEIPVNVKNVGNREGSEVIQVYCAEKAPHILRPGKELVGFAKVHLNKGEQQQVNVRISKDALYCFDQKKSSWVLPVGSHNLWIGTSSADIVAQADLNVIGKSAYTLDADSTIGEVLKNPQAVKLVNDLTNGFLEKSSAENLAFMVDRHLSEILSTVMISIVPDAVRLNQLLQDFYEKLSQLS